MNKELIIHIGTHKTASTSIQKYLIDNATALLADNIDYLPQLTTWSAHHSLGWVFGDRDDAIKKYCANDSNKDIIHVFANAVNKSKADKIVISSETLFRVKNCKKLERFKELLNKEITVKVIVYLRKQSKFLKSWYSELTTATYAKRSASFYSYFKNPQYELDYLEQLNKWANVFGKTSIQPYDFNDISVSSNITKHFFSRNLPHYKGEIINHNKRSSLPLELIEVIRLMNKHQIPDEDRLQIINLLQKYASNEKSTIHFSDFLSEIDAKYHTTNIELAREYGIKFK